MILFFFWLPQFVSLYWQLLFFSPRLSRSSLTHCISHSSISYLIVADYLAYRCQRIFPPPLSGSSLAINPTKASAISSAFLVINPTKAKQNSTPAYLVLLLLRTSYGYAELTEQTNQFVKSGRSIQFPCYSFWTNPPQMIYLLQTKDISGYSRAGNTRTKRHNRYSKQSLSR